MSDDWSRWEEAENEAKKRSQEEKKSAEYKSKRKIDKLVCKIKDDYRGKGNVEISKDLETMGYGSYTLTDFMGYTHFEASQSYNEYGVSSQTKTSVYRGGYAGTINVNTGSVDLSPDIDVDEYTDYEVVKSGTNKISEEIYVRVTDNSGEFKKLEKQLLEEPLEYMGTSKESHRKEVYLKSHNPRGESVLYAIRNIFCFLLNIFLTLSLIFLVGIYGSQRKPLYDEIYLNKLLPGISNFLNNTISFGYIFYGASVVSLIMYIIFNMKLCYDSTILFKFDVVALLCIAAFFILSLIYAKGAPNRIEISQRINDKIGVFLGQVLFLLPDLIISTLDFVFTIVYYTWTGIRPILLFLLIISVLVSLVILFRRKGYRDIMDNYLYGVAEATRADEWNRENFDRVSEMIAKYESHIFKIDEDFYQRYLDTL